VSRSAARKPTFLFIGAGKTGSKWLHDIMLQHAEIYVPTIADPYYFDRLYHKGMDWYLRLFAGAPAEAKAIGELSHDYLHSRVAAERVKADLPGVRLLVCLRNPMDHIISSYLGLVRAGATKATLSEALEEFPELLAEPSYAEHLETWFELFDHSQIRVLLYDDLRASPKEFAREVFDFLGVSTPDSIDYDRVVNSSTQPRSYLVSRVVRVGKNAARKAGFVGLVGTVKRNQRVWNLLYRPTDPVEKPRLSEADHARLAPRFREEIGRLSALIGRDLSAWEKDWA